MKVIELFEASSFYYEKRMIGGKVTDFLKEIGATKEDIAKAIALLKKTPQWKAAVDKMKFVSTPVQLSHGMLEFDRMQGNEKHKVYRNASGEHLYPNQHYEISATGQIRTYGSAGKERHTRLSSAEPDMNAGSAVDILLSCYKNALELAVKKHIAAEKAYLKLTNK